MNILVDADACPVKDIIVRIARKHNLKVIMLCDTSHMLNDGYSEVVVVDKSRDSVDFALVNKINKGDIVISQDYGVAAMSLAKGAKVLNQNGMIYNEGNMDRLLFERHISQKVRRAGGRTSGPGKRTAEDNEKFEKAFRGLIEQGI
jgi:uncharacterized protein